MKTLTRILLTQPWAYALLIVIVLASLGYDYEILGWVLLSGIVLSFLNELRKPSGMKTDYTVKKGKDYCFHRPTIHFGKKTMEGEFTLWEDAKYPKHEDNPGQINKVTGISWGNHHENSIRIGVVYNQDDTFDIIFYAYIDGQPVRRKMYTSKVGEKIKYKLGKKKDIIFVKLFNRNGESLAYEYQNAKVDTKIGYFLFPYHENSTSDWKVELQYYR